MCKRMALVGLAAMAFAAGACASHPTGKNQTTMTSSTPQSTVAPAGISVAAPGTDARIQKWFLDAEKTRITFDNILLKAEQDIATGSTHTNCSALVTATAKIKGEVSNLSAISPAGAEIAAAYGPPIDQFSDSAAACVAGDFNTARNLIGNNTGGAIAAYGSAQETVDEILDGGR